MHARQCIQYFAQDQQKKTAFTRKRRLIVAVHSLEGLG